VNVCNSDFQYANTVHHQIGLNLDPLLTDVVTVLGSEHNDYIIGNEKGNYISAGKDYSEGRNG